MLFYRECEVGVWIRFVFQGEVPPLGVERLESVTQHSLSQYHTVLELPFRDAAPCGTLMVVAVIFACLGIAAEVGMTLRTEPVECASHIYFFLCIHVEEGEVNRRASCVSALLHDILLLEEHALVKVGIEVCLHLRVAKVCRPTHEVVNGLLRAVGVINLVCSLDSSRRR